MKKNSQITQEDFDNLLGWFSPDREEAGEKYEQVRQGLIRYFRYRGCGEPESLTDETINRVAKKLNKLNFDGNLKIITYFYSFAANIYLEDVTKKPKKESLNDSKKSLSDKKNDRPDEAAELEFDCLDDCLAKLRAEEGNLVIQYYSEDKKAKSELRKKLAERMNLRVSALHTKVHRLRIVLGECLKKCLAEKSL